MPLLFKKTRQPLDGTLIPLDHFYLGGDSNASLSEAVPNLVMNLTSLSSAPLPAPIFKNLWNPDIDMVSLTIMARTKEYILWQKRGNNKHMLMGPCGLSHVIIDISQILLHKNHSRQSRVGACPPAYMH